jgi:uncharacterized protein YbcI
MEGPERAEREPRPPPVPSVEAMEAEISREILAIQLDSYGRGAASVRAHVLDDTVLVLLDGLELQPSEEYLIESGRPETVVVVRNQFEQAIAPNFSAVIERVTGRRVVGFASQQQVSEPRFAVEVFRMKPV